MGKEPVDVFRKIRDISGEVVEALEAEDAAAAEVAVGKFVLLMLQLDALK